MPAVSAPDLVRLRTTRHATILALAVYQPAVIWTAQVNGNPAFRATSIPVDNVVQVRAPVKQFQVLFGTTPGARDLGEARFRSYSAPTLVIAANNVDLSDNDYITIVEWMPPASIHPTIDNNDVVSEDGNIAYSGSLNIQYPPLARMGPPAFAYRDVNGNAVIKFYSDSQIIAPGAALSSHAWNFQDGSPATSTLAGTSGSPISVTYNTAGARYVSYTVTDSNGKTHTRYTPVFIFDRDAGTLPYRQVEVSGWEGDRESGVYRCHLKVLGVASASVFPEQAMVVLAAEDWFGDEQISIGGNYVYRENIAFVGYIRKGTVSIDWTGGGAVEFDAESVSGVMTNMWQLAGGLETATTPTGWHQLKGLDFNLGAHHVLTQHSTVSQIADVHLNLLSYLVEFVDLAETNIKDGLSQIAAWTRGQVGCDMQGTLWLEPYPQYEIPADRPATATLSTDNTDLRGPLDFGEDLQEKRSAQIDFAGENALADPVFSLAPATPWPSGQSQRVDGVRVVDQTESNILSGLYEGHANNPFDQVVLNWRGNYRVLDVYPAAPIKVTIAAAQNRRGINWSQQVCWIKRVTLDYRSGILTAAAVVEKDSYGPPGITGEYPTVPPPIPPPVPPPIPPPIPPPTPGPGPDTTPGDGSRAYVGTSKGVARGDTLLTAPTWTAVNTGLSTTTAKQIRNLLFDPWSSDGTQLTAMYALTDDGVFKGTGLPNPTWSLVLSNAQILSLTGASVMDALNTTPASGHASVTENLLLPITTQNYAAIVVCRLENSWTATSRLRLMLVYSTDGGVNWNCNQNNWIGTMSGNNGFNYICSLSQSGVLYALIEGNNDSAVDQDHPAGIGGSYKPDFFQLDSAGHATPKSAFFSTDDGYDLKFDILYADAAGNVIGNDNHIRWTNQHGHAYTGITSSKGFNEISNPFSPAYGSGYITETNRSDAGMGFGWLIDWCTWSPNDVYLTDSYGAGNNAGIIWDSHDGGLTWHSTNLAPAFSPTGMAIRGISALPGNKSLCMVANNQDVSHPTGLVGLTVNGGTAWTDISANLQSVLGLNVAGGEARQIKPDWIWVTP